MDVCSYNHDVVIIILLHGNLVLLHVIEAEILVFIVPDQIMQYLNTLYTHFPSRIIFFLILLQEESRQLFWVNKLYITCVVSLDFS